jgi:16S rRNA (uracil1498-N3)-methyltransferase
LAPEEEAAARAAGFVAVSLGPRVLRADTAPLAALAWWSIAAHGAAPDGPG